MESKPLFRIGGVYRNGNGSVCQILSNAGDGFVLVGIHGWESPLAGRWKLLTGRHEHDSLGQIDGIALIPGELHEVAVGQWVPVEEESELPELVKNFVKREEAARACTCHPDDSPPVPCAKKYAYSECVSAADAAMIARDGPAKPKLILFKHIDCAGCPECTGKPAAKPALSGLTTVRGFDHRLGMGR